MMINVPAVSAIAVRTASGSTESSMGKGATAHQGSDYA